MLQVFFPPHRRNYFGQFSPRLRHLSDDANATAVLTERAEFSPSFAAENVLFDSCETIRDRNGNEIVAYWVGPNYFTGTAFVVDLGALVISGAVAIRNARNWGSNDR